MPTKEQQEVYDSWLAEASKNGLQWEVFNDVVEGYFRRHPEECLMIMNDSMMDWDM
jgi:hypothetical protein